MGINPLFDYKAVMIDYDLDRFIDNGYFKGKRERQSAVSYFGYYFYLYEHIFWKRLYCHA